MGGLGDYSYGRVHSEYGMVGRTPYGCCVASGGGDSWDVRLVLVVLLDNSVLDWSREGLAAVDDVLTDYRIGSAKAPVSIFYNYLFGCA